LCDTIDDGFCLIAVVGLWRHMMDRFADIGAFDCHGST
jgi:hypothetical protein